MSKLYPFQREGVNWLKTQHRALLADSCGLGKTVQAITAVKELSLKKVLIICPSTVKYGWQNEFKCWYPGFPVQIIEAKDVIRFSDFNAWIINYDIIHRKDIASILLAQRYDAIICDEAHYLKNGKAKRTKMLYAKKGLADRTNRIWLMTGTPVLNRPVELYATLKRLVPGKLDKFVDYMAYTKYFCSGHDSKWGWNVSGASHIPELSQILTGFMLRRDKQDVLSQLPEKTLQKIVFPADSIKLKEVVEEEKKAYGQQEKDKVLGAYAAARGTLGVEKLPLVFEHIDTLLEEKEKLVVFAHHRKVLEALHDRYVKTMGVSLLYGGLTSRKKQDVIDAFVNKSSVRLFLGQIDAAGTGVDGLQKVCDTIVFAETSWVPGQLNQAIDRCHRIGQNNKVLIQFLVVKGSIDEDILESVLRKSKTIKKLITGVEHPTTKENSMSIENSLERIASALEQMHALGSANVKTPLAAAVSEPEASAEIVFSDAPTSPTKKAEPKKKNISGPQTPMDLLKYCNAMILPLPDKVKAKAIVVKVMARLQTELNAQAIKDLPEDPEVIDHARKIFDEEYQKGMAK